MISVIVPVYKAEAYLRRCVDSVLNQTWGDLELILVDDGSPDGCGAICDAYAAADSRVRVFHKENGGVSSARNLGLDHARGEFVAFLDSDDWYHPQALELWYRAAEEFDADGVTAQSLWTPTEQVEASALSYSEIGKRHLSGEQIRREFYKLAYSGSDTKDTLTCGLYGMYRRTCFQGVRFDESIVCGEDVLVLFQVNLAARSVVHLDTRLYYYYTGNESAMRSGLTKGKLTVLDALLKIARVLEKLPEQADKVYYRYIFSYLDFDLRVSREQTPELCHAMAGHREELKKHYRSLRKNPHLSFMERWTLRLCVWEVPGYRKFIGKYAPGMERKLWTFVVR